MKKFILFFLIFFTWQSSSFAKIIINNCDLSPVYKNISMKIDIEKMEVEIEQENIFSKKLKINEKNATVISTNLNQNNKKELFLIDIKSGVLRLTNNINDTVVNAVCDLKNTYSKEQQQDQGVIISASFEEKIERSAVQCRKAGYKTNTDKQEIEFYACLAYVYAIFEERELSRKLKKEKISLNSKYESKTGEEINRESKWTKFWKGVGWMLHEHGEEILNVILDVKYGTNYSGYNNNQTVKHSGRLNCINQRVGTVVHQNCKGQGVHIYCMYQKVSSTQWRRTCREK